MHFYQIGSKKYRESRIFLQKLLTRKSYLHIMFLLKNVYGSDGISNEGLELYLIKKRGYYEEKEKIYITYNSYIDRQYFALLFCKL